MKTLSTSMTGSAGHSHTLRTAALLCAFLLAASVPLVAQTPAPAPPAAADAPVVITKPLADQSRLKPVSRRQARQADDAYLAGSALMAKKQPEKALKEFQRAARLDPEKQQYAMASAIALENVVSDMVHKSELQRSSGDPTGADALLAAAARLDPNNQIVTEHLHQDEARVEIVPNPTVIADANLRFAPPTEFAANQSTQSFHLRAPGHELLRQILEAYGLKAQFSDDVPSVSARIDIDNVTFQQMRPVLETLTQSFLVPIDPKTALALKNTQENHKQFDRLAVETVYMPGFSKEEVADASKLLQEVLGMQHVVVDGAAGTITLKAPADMLKIANYELADLMDGGSELLLEMRVYSVDKTNMRNIGVSVGSSITAFNLYTEASQIISQYQTQIAAAIASGLIPANANELQILEGLAGAGLLSGNPLVSGGVATFGGGLTFTGVSPASLPSLNLGLNQSDARSLEDLQMSVGDKKTATFRVGSRYPIVTSTYSEGGGASSLLAGASASQLAALGLTSATAAAAATQVTVPQVEYEDLGLTLKAEPTVLRSGDIYMKLDLKIEALSGSTLNGNPILSNTALTSTVTLVPGQAAMLATSMTREQDNAVSGIPGLSEIPGFQSTTDDQTNANTSELVITLTPRIVRRGHDRIANVPLLLPASSVAAEGGGGGGHDEN